MDEPSIKVRPVRKPTRLRRYDYNYPTAYFLTICTCQRRCILSHIVGAILSKMVGCLKMNVTKQMHQTGWMGNLWQRNFHDHIIRDDTDYRKIWTYIDNNPVRWTMDCFYID